MYNYYKGLCVVVFLFLPWKNERMKFVSSVGRREWAEYINKMITKRKWESTQLVKITYQINHSLMHNSLFFRWIFFLLLLLLLIVVFVFVVFKSNWIVTVCMCVLLSCEHFYCFRWLNTFQLNNVHFILSQLMIISCRVLIDYCFCFSTQLIFFFSHNVYIHYFYVRFDLKFIDVWFENMLLVL